MLCHEGQDWLRGRPLPQVYDLDLDLNNCEASDVQICGFNVGSISCGVDSPQAVTGQTGKPIQKL